MTNASLANTSLAKSAAATADAGRNAQAINWGGLAATSAVLVAAVAWIFPLYWAIVTSIKPETEVVRKGSGLVPSVFSLDAYTSVFAHTNIVSWYINSVSISLIVTFIVLAISLACAYALSQVSFPGRRMMFVALAASVMVPIEALIINHFVLMNVFGFIDTWEGIILPQLVVPSAVIIFKQFFDQIPKDYREAATMDNAGHFRILFSIYIPMNWGVITAIGITTFIGAWNNFLWPFLVATSETTMTIPVGITQVHDAFGLHYARDMATAVLAGLPVAALYLIFQRRITQAIMLSAGIKG
jgi:multiple sugar transport system permease protein